MPRSANWNPQFFSDLTAVLIETLDNGRFAFGYGHPHRDFKGRNQYVAPNAANYLQAHSQFAISAMTRFEVVRGLRHKQANKMLASFSAMCARMVVFPISDDVLDRAADLWVSARHGGHPQRDADLIIAATALAHGRTLVTGNTAHFQWISGLSIRDWRTS